MTDYEAHFIGGNWVTSKGTGRLEAFDSTTEQIMGSVPSGDVNDADAAVAAARSAFPSWSTISVEERAGYLERIAAGITQRSGELGPLIARETGMPLWLCELGQVGVTAALFAQFAELVRSYPFEEQVGTSLVVREAAGVVACITPWNYPIVQVAGKVGAALAAGCTIVLKPSEIAPLSNILLAEIVEAAGLPAGVYNLVNGTGAEVGEALAGHAEVDMVSFTGSTRAGRRVGELAGGGVKRVTLELGGKSANVLLDDLDDAAFDAAVADGVGKAYFNSGQTCAALTRMLVPRSRLERAEAVAGATAEALPLGDPFAEGMILGPLASAAQRDRVQKYIQQGIDEGAKLVAGGLGAPEGLDKGYYVRATVFSEVTTEMTIAREEIFGPVLSILAYDDDDHAVEIANATVYGLAGGVRSADVDRAKAFALRMQTGQIEINGAQHNLLAPFGGYKQSGVGRELGLHGLTEYLETKSLQL